MSWTSRYGLNILSDSTSQIDDIDLNQNIKARIALGRFLSEIIGGGEGIYSGGADNLSELPSGNNYPAFSIVIYDDSGFPWYFENTASASIDFNISSGNGVLYAIIDTELFIDPKMASANYNDVSFVVEDETQDPPNNSLKLGFGVVSASVFTSYTVENISFAPIALSNYFYIKGNSDITKIINSKNLFSILGENGVVVTNPSDLQFNIGPNLSTTGGLKAEASGLSVKLAPSSGLSLSGSGLVVSSIAAPQFILSGNSGPNQTIVNSDTMLMAGNGVINTVTSDNTVTVSLQIHDDGGLFEINNNLSIKLKNNSGLVLTTSGIDKIPSYFYISADIGDNKSVVEDNNLEIYGSGPITTSRTVDNTVDISLSLATISGLEQDDNGLILLLKQGGGFGLTANGLENTEYTRSSLYGHPSSGYHSESDFYRDKSGALWVCDTSGIPGEWRQLNVGVTLEVSGGAYAMPSASSFNGSFIPPGYKIRWNYLYDPNNFVTAPTSMIWVWYFNNLENNNGYWLSEDVIRIKFQRENELIVSSVNNLCPMLNDATNSVGINYFSIFEGAGGYGNLINIYVNSASSSVFYYDGTNFGRKTPQPDVRWVLNLNDQNIGSSADAYDGLYIENMQLHVSTKIHNPYSIVEPRNYDIGYYEGTNHIVTYTHNAIDDDSDESISVWTISNRALKFTTDVLEVAYWKIDNGPFIYGSSDIYITGICKILPDHKDIQDIISTGGNVYIEISTNWYKLDNLSDITKVSDYPTNQFNGLLFDGVNLWGFSNSTSDLYLNTSGTTWAVDGTLPDAGYGILGLALYDDGGGAKVYAISYKSAIGMKLYRYDGSNIFTTIDTSGSPPFSKMVVTADGLIYSPDFGTTITAYNGSVTNLYSGALNGNIVDMYGSSSAGDFTIYFITDHAYSIEDIFIFELHKVGGFYQVDNNPIISGTGNTVSAIYSSIYNKHYVLINNVTESKLFYSLNGISFSELIYMNNQTELWSSKMIDNNGDLYFIINLLQSPDYGNYIYKLLNHEIPPTLNIDSPSVTAAEFDLNLRENIFASIQVVADIRYLLDGS